MAVSALERRGRMMRVPAEDRNFKDGYDGPCLIRPEDSKLARTCKLGIEARRKRRLGLGVDRETAELWKVLERGYPENGAAPTNYYSEAMHVIEELDLDEERFLDWGTWFISRPDRAPYHSYNCCAAEKVLERLGVSVEQQQALTRMFAPVPPGHGRRALELAERTGIERVVDGRLRMYRGDLSQVRGIRRCTRLSALDRWYLSEVLWRGWARDREKVLGLVEELDLAGPELEDAVRRCAGDCDDRVRVLAREVCDRRGW